MYIKTDGGIGIDIYLSEGWTKVTEMFWKKKKLIYRFTSIYFHSKDI
jgi:hypothetical protein